MNYLPRLCRRVKVRHPIAALLMPALLSRRSLPGTPASGFTERRPLDCSSVLEREREREDDCSGEFNSLARARARGVTVAVTDRIDRSHRANFHRRARERQFCAPVTAFIHVSSRIPEVVPLTTSFGSLKLTARAKKRIRQPDRADNSS